MKSLESIKVSTCSCKLKHTVSFLLFLCSLNVLKMIISHSNLELLHISAGARNSVEKRIDFKRQISIPESLSLQF